MTKHTNEEPDLTTADGVLAYLEQRTRFRPRVDVTPQRLTGGISAFTFRVLLESSDIKNGSRSSSAAKEDGKNGGLGEEEHGSIVLKHSRPYSAANEGFKLEPGRSVCTPCLLLTLNCFSIPNSTLSIPLSPGCPCPAIYNPHSRTANTRFHNQHIEASSLQHVHDLFPQSTPQLLYEDATTSLLILSDAASLDHTITLRSFLLSPVCTSSSSSSSPQTPGILLAAAAIGTELSNFLAKLHEFGRTPAAAPLRRALSSTANVAAPLLFRATYGSLAASAPALERPECSVAFLAVEEEMRRLLLDPAPPEITDSSDTDADLGTARTVLHGDFHPLNILVAPSPTPFISPSPSQSSGITVLDWEMARVAPAFLDAAQMAAELYTATRVRGSYAAAKVLRTFLDGVMEREEWMGCARGVRLFLIALGTHLVVWTPRVEAWQPDGGPVVDEGAELIRAAWASEWAVLRKGPWARFVQEGW